MTIAAHTIDQIGIELRERLYSTADHASDNLSVPEEACKPVRDSKRNDRSKNRRSDTVWHFDDLLEAYLRKYRLDPRPIAVNFRDIVPLSSGVDRATHLLHSYPAKLLLNIPLFFTNCEQLTSRGDLIADPFCGTGTTLLEAVLAGRRAAGSDANPLARLISRAKLSSFDPSYAEDVLRRMLDGFPASDAAAFSPVVAVDRWFAPGTQQSIGKIITTIEQHADGEVKFFLLACLSSCLRKLSYADLRLSVPVRRKNWSSAPVPDALATFKKTVLANLARLRNLQRLAPERLPVPLGTDARKISDLAETTGQADLIITSPPYVGAQKYIRASSLSIGWLNLAPSAQLRTLERQNIGREHYSKFELTDVGGIELASCLETLAKIQRINPLRAHIAANYIREMSDAMQSAMHFLKPGGHLVLVIGNNQICGNNFPTSTYLAEIISGMGGELMLELVDDIRSYGLMTKRNRTAGIISCEHILLFKKNET